MSSSRTCRWSASATACRSSPSRCSGRARSRRLGRAAGARGQHHPLGRRVRLRDRADQRGSWARAYSIPENVNSTLGIPDFLASLDQLEASLPNCRSASLVVAWFGNDLRAGHCEIRPGVEVSDEDHQPAQLGRERRLPRRRPRGVARRQGRSGLRRHAGGLRGGAGDPGAEGARLPRHLLSLHPDGRAGGQHAAGPVLRTAPRGPASRPSPGAAGSPARRRRATPVRSTRPRPRPRRSRPSSATPSPPTSPSRARASTGPAPPATGACAG